MLLAFILTLLVLLAVVTAPRYGLIARWRAARALAARVRREDALKHILKAEVNGRPSSLSSVAGALRIGEDRAATLLADLERGGLLTFEGGAPRLREPGRELAQHVVRAHRLWESFLADQTGVGEAEWHNRAERHEHLLSPEQVNRLAAQLGHPLRDPHGDTIPAGGEALAADAGQPLTDVPVGQAVEIVHIEDEPDAVYRQLLAAGLRPGLAAKVERRTEEGVDLLTEDGRRLALGTVLANNVAVVALAGGAVTSASLAGLRTGERARVAGLAAACRGAARRRLLDLGFVPGTPVEVDLVSPGGDPTAYRVRGAVVALRREQAALIRIVPEKQEAAA